jgi:NAD(P) transhydrogenase
MGAHYDLIVIGTGPAGLHGAIQAAKLGKRVAAIESRRKPGGVCVNEGTIPSKAVREASIYLSGIRERPFYGSSYTLKSNITMQDITERVSYVVKNEQDVIQGHLKRNRIDFISGHARFTGPREVQVRAENGQIDEYAADVILIAVGTRAAHSDDFPVDGRYIFDASNILDAPQIPGTLTVVGAGVIGVEYASMFAALGSEVRIVEQQNRMLGFVDEEITQTLQYHLREMDVRIMLGEKCTSCKRDSKNNLVVEMESRKQVRTDAVLYAVGREGNTADLNLAAGGIEPDERGRIPVDVTYRTAVEHVYAAGDVIGFPALASTSMEQGRVAVCHAFGAPVTSRPEFYPYGIYTIPEISYVGKNEQQLTEERVPYARGVARFRETARGQLIGETKGMLKLLFHRETLELLGVHILGEGAAELIHIGQSVMAFGGTIEYFTNTVFNYPTLAETYRIAAFSGLNKLVVS